MYFGCCINDSSKIKEVKAAGYDFYEFSGTALSGMDEGTFFDLVNETVKNGIPCIGFNAYCPGRPSMAGEAFSEREIEDYADRICARGKALSVANIGIGAPKARILPDGYDYSTAVEQLGRFLSITSQIARYYSINVLMESVHSGLCNLVTRTSEAFKIVDELKADNLFMVLDFYHMEMMGETLDSIDVATPYLKHTHISTKGENLFRGFPQADESEKYKEIISRLKNRGYNLTMSVEPSMFDFSLAAGTLEMLKSIDEKV